MGAGTNAIRRPCRGGVVVKGGSSLLHFIDVKHMVRLLGATAGRLGWPPRLEHPSSSSVDSANSGGIR